ncbi:MAG: polysaccharide biosynthesis protein, partial [Herminiimonas sp.]|nr:polysaccharide biosynthesis protein [Herminiimonas sp.]
MKSFLDLPRYKKQFIAAAADLLFLPLAFCLAILLRYDLVNVALFREYLWIIIATPIIALPIFVRVGLYRAVIRFIDQKLVYSAVVSVTLSVLLLGA